MSDMPFKCPKCGKSLFFYADSVILTNARVDIEMDGWNYWDCDADVEVPPEAHMECGACGYIDEASEFYI